MTGIFHEMGSRGIQFSQLKTLSFEYKNGTKNSSNRTRLVVFSQLEKWAKNENQLREKIARTSEKSRILFEEFSQSNTSCWQPSNTPIFEILTLYFILRKTHYVESRRNRT